MKERYNVPQEAGVFIVKGGFSSLKNYLQSKGWYENEDKFSNYFDLKFTLSSKDINNDLLIEE